jgi:hypothetical protein
MNKYDYFKNTEIDAANRFENYSHWNGRMQDLAQLPESTMTRNVRELIYDVQRNFEHKMHRILGNYVGVINPKVRCYIYETDSQQIVLKIGILVTNREDSWEAASNQKNYRLFKNLNDTCVDAGCS